MGARTKGISDTVAYGAGTTGGLLQQACLNTAPKIFVISDGGIDGDGFPIIAVGVGQVSLDIIIGHIGVFRRGHLEADFVL